jgi:hypothetical protein
VETDMREEVLALTECGVASEDCRLNLGFRTTGGGDSTLTVSVEQAGALLMTLPRLIERALRQRHADPSLRYVFPLGDWTLETSPDQGQLILNLRTSDGFAVSFVIARDAVANLAAALDGSDENAQEAVSHH